ncbi:hypothetical protein C5167_024127 [Papaver somniferum]|uniref:Uncharacterized protein n=1 Tax=Papaver somniferum TaxID=3469 RepID=A0A4Y7JML0_PAPSO|nr:hypothetical protein C5167_024127 [Papaver somniferum]
MFRFDFLYQGVVDHGGGDSGRDGDWMCPNSSCGNSMAGEVHIMVPMIQEEVDKEVDKVDMMWILCSAALRKMLLDFLSYGRIMMTDAAARNM